MIIYVPVQDSPATGHKTIVVLVNPHNHPMHPPSMPSTEDKLKLNTAVNLNAAGLNRLTVQKLLNGSVLLFISLCFDLLRLMENIQHHLH
jgi:hypothetical protein